MFLLLFLAVLASTEALRLPNPFTSPPSSNLQNPQPSSYHNPLEELSIHNTNIHIVLQAKIRANVTKLHHSGQWVDVHWSGVPDPRYDDYIALYPATANPKQTAPLKFRMAARSPTHLSLGFGSLAFRLLNYRQDLKFVVLRNGLQFPIVAAESEDIEVVSANQPTQGHLSLTGKYGEVAVQWVTRDVGHPQVQYGMESGQYVTVVMGRTGSYGREDMCGPPASTTGWMDPGSLHMAIMCDLTPGRKYYYRYGDPDFGWSAEYSFTALPFTPSGSNINTSKSSQSRTDSTSGSGGGGGSSGNEVKVLAVADLGQAEIDGSLETSQMLASLSTTARIADDVKNGGYQLLIHNGDISYARGYSSQWDVFWDQLAPAVHAVPYMTAIGNHERDWPGTGDRFNTAYDSGGECGIPYYRRTKMPTKLEDEPWYSFDLGPIHFLQYSTEHDTSPGSRQYEFMAQDLAAVDREKTPWVVLGGHRPLYVDSTLYILPDGDQKVAQQLRENLEPLLYRYQVDATWHGHHHSYQRTCPVLNGHCIATTENSPSTRLHSNNTNYSTNNTSNIKSQLLVVVAVAPVHLIIGHGGAGLTPNVHFRRPAIFEAVKLQHGYMRVWANRTHMHHQVVASGDGGVMDEFVLKKPDGWVYKERQSEEAADLKNDSRNGKLNFWGFS